MMESNIKKLRQERGMSQTALGDALGVSQQVISRMERDRERICVKHLVKIAEYFGVSTDYILNFKEPSGQEEVSDFILEKLKDLSGTEVFEIFQRVVGEVRGEGE